MNLCILYRVQNVLIHQKFVQCINVRPDVFDDLLTTLPDFIQHFFPHLSNCEAHQMLQEKLKIVLYKGNRGHQEVLRASGKYCFDPVPLMLVKDLLHHWDQINCMFFLLLNQEINQKISRKIWRVVGLWIQLGNDVDNVAV